MNHSFIASQFDALRCAKCKRTEIDHTDKATCDCCSNSGNMEVYIDMLMCSECIGKEKALQAVNNTPQAIQARVDSAIPEKGVLSMGNLVDKAREIDTSMQVSTDVFNAETVSIYEVFKSIDEDVSIPSEDKQFARAKYLREHQVKVQQTVFDAQKTIMEGNTKLRVIQQEINKITGLRADQRAALQIQSPDYKPTAAKTPKAAAGKPRAPKKTFDMARLRTVCAELIAEGYVMASAAFVQGICTRRGMTPDEAAQVVRTTLRKVE